MFPRIPGFDNFLTRGLTYGHIVDMYVQDDVQVAKQYSESEAKEIMNNMLTQFHIQTKDRDTNQAVSERLGEIEVQKEIVNSQMGEQQQDKGNRQISIDKMPLLSAKELEELNDGEMVIMRTAKRNDKKWRRIRPLPIFDTGKTLMPNAHDLIGQSYHLDYYTTDLRIKNNTKSLSYQDIFQDYSGYYQQLATQVNPETQPAEENFQEPATVANTATTPETTAPEPSGNHVAATLPEKNTLESASQTIFNTEESTDTKTNSAVSEPDDVGIDDFTLWQQEFEKDPTASILTGTDLANPGVIQKFEELVIAELEDNTDLSEQQMKALKLAKEHVLVRKMPGIKTRQELLHLFNDEQEEVFNLEEDVKEFKAANAG
ncbi:TraM recognition domain-containing protein [Weissella paramesenteroides]|uniref:TraM recognition domain-containing protein n=1 Tax=Weissella paramesenteroides TaxID=1249 RepID=UPI003F74509D